MHWDEWQQLHPQYFHSDTVPEQGRQVVDSWVTGTVRGPLVCFCDFSASWKLFTIKLAMLKCHGSERIQVPAAPTASQPHSDILLPGLSKREDRRTHQLGSQITLGQGSAGCSVPAWVWVKLGAGGFRIHLT